MGLIADVFNRVRRNRIYPNWSRYVIRRFVKRALLNHLDEFLLVVK